MWIPEEPQTIAADTTPVTIAITQDQTKLPGGRGQLAILVENNGAVEACLVWDSVTGASPLKVPVGASRLFQVQWNTRVYKLWASASCSCDVTVATAPEGWAGAPPFYGDGGAVDVADIETELLAQGVSLDTLLLLQRLPRECMYRAGPSDGMDTTAVYASASTITLGGLSWTIDTVDILWVEVHRVGGTYEYFDRAVCTVAAGVLTIAGTPALLATDEYVVHIAGPPRGYVAGSTNWRAFITNWEEPVYEEWHQESDATSGATNFYRTSLEGYNNYRFDYDLTDGVLKFYTATKPTAATPAEAGAVTSEWNEETALGSPITTGAATQLNGAVDVEYTGAIAILFEWTPNDATSELEINGKRGY